jgi:hypothetical protein
VLARIVDTIFCGTPFVRLEKRKLIKKRRDKISRMLTHQCRSILFLFFANCKNFSQLGEEIGSHLVIYQIAMAHLATIDMTAWILTSNRT